MPPKQRRVWRKKTGRRHLASIPLAGMEQVAHRADLMIRAHGVNTLLKEPGREESIRRAGALKLMTTHEEREKMGHAHILAERILSNLASRKGGVLQEIEERLEQGHEKEPPLLRQERESKLVQFDDMAREAHKIAEGHFNLDKAEAFLEMVEAFKRLYPERRY